MNIINNVRNVAMNPTFLTRVNTNVDLDAMMGGIVDIIIKLAMYVGVALAVGGAFSLLLAYKDGNSTEQSSAVRLVVIGAALMGFRGLLALTGIIGG